MQIKIGLEEKNENRYIAWALDYPGCFGYGESEAEAIIRFPQDFLAYQSWINFKAGKQSWLWQIQDLDIRLAERFDNYYSDEPLQAQKGKELVGAWFQSDRRPLTAPEIEQAAKILEWSRKDLLDLWESIAPAAMNIRLAGERWTIAEIFKHIANSEHWYLDQIGKAQYREIDLPISALERLLTVRENLLAVLPQFEGLECIQETRGELWSPRKVIRRAVWHEKDHLVHIQKILLSL
jgi:uncharacterized damage-inducible protein DinB